MATTEASTAETGQAGLIRDLSLFDVTMVGVGAMIGAGIFVLTGIAAGEAGPALILAFALNGVVTVLTAMVYAELGSAIPEAGGGYLWVKEGLPSWNAFLAGWMSWFAHAVAGSLYALAFGSYFAEALGHFGVSPFGIGGDLLAKGLAVVIALLFIAINFKGVSETGTAGNVVTVAKVIILAIFVASGIWVIVDNPEFLNKFTPFVPEGWTSIVVAMGLTFIAFEGYEIIVQAGEEVVDPKRNIPKAVFYSLVIVIPIYMLVAFAALGAVTPESAIPTWQWLGEFGELGLVEAAGQFMPLGTVLLLLGGLLSTMSALNATTFSSTRVSFAMGRDRNLPDAFGKIHERTRTPYLALLFSGALIIFMALALPIHDVAAAADVMFLLLFLQVNLAVITIRKKYGDKLDYGYLVPFFPALPIINMGLILILAVFMFQFSALAWFFVIGWIGTGLAIYWLYASKREREKTLTPIVMQQRVSAPAERFQVLVPIANPGAAETTLPVAARIARPVDGELVLLHVGIVAPQTPYAGGRRVLDEMRPIIDRSAEIAGESGLAHESLVRMGHKPSAGIIHTVEERNAEFVVMGWRGRPRDPKTALGQNVDDVFKHTPANVVVVQEGAPVPADRILIPIANPAQTHLLLSVGRLLRSDEPDARITLLHVVPPELPEAERTSRREEFEEVLRQPAFFDPEGTEVSPERERVFLEFEEATDALGAIVARTSVADVAIVGSSQTRWLHRRVVGELPYRIARDSDCPLVMINPGTHGVKFGIQTFFQFFRELEDEAEDAVGRGSHGS